MKKIFAIFVSLSLLFSSSISMAGIISSDNAILSMEAQEERTHVISLLSRDEVKQEMVTLGVNPEDALRRVNSLTDAEIAQLHDRLTDEAAGQDILTIGFFVFVVFVITDVIGATDLFPFIKPVR